MDTPATSLKYNGTSEQVPPKTSSKWRGTNGHRSEVWYSRKLRRNEVSEGATIEDTMCSMLNFECGRMALMIADYMLWKVRMIIFGKLVLDATCATVRTDLRHKRSLNFAQIGIDFVETFLITWRSRRTWPSARMRK